MLSSLLRTLLVLRTVYKNRLEATRLFGCQSETSNTETVYHGSGFVHADSVEYVITLIPCTNRRLFTPDVLYSTVQIGHHIDIPKALTPLVATVVQQIEQVQFELNARLSAWLLRV